MAVKIPLKMSDGAVVRTIEDLREHFDLEAVLGYYSSGRLAEWLEERYCEKEAAEVRKLDADAKDFNETFCAVLGVVYEKKAGDKTDLGHVRKKNERLDKVKKYTMNDEILSAVDWVAFTQEELDSLLKKIKTRNENEKRVIYLCGENFVIPTNIENITYIGINNPLVQFDEGVVASSIDLQDLQFDITDYVKDCSWGMMHDVFENNLSLGLKLLRQEADQGNADAQFVFGIWCWGDDEIADMTENVEPMEWWQKAADQGHIEANVWVYHFRMLLGMNDTDAREAVKWFEKAIEQKSIYSDVAYESLAACYLKGVGVEQDCEKGFMYLKRADEEGDISADSKYYFGFCYYYGAGVEKEYSEAVKWLQMAVDEGSQDARVLLGMCYEYGRGIEKDEKKAVSLYEEAAERWDQDAQYLLGCCYAFGNGVEVDYEKAAEWLQKAIHFGYQNEHAKEVLELCKKLISQDQQEVVEEGGNQEEDEDSIDVLKKAAKQGDAEAQYQLGHCYYSGDGVEESHLEALKWFRKAAEQGFARAQCELGNCYCTGNGIEENHTEAFKWYRKAAEQGDAEGQYQLGYCYYFGIGVNPDDEKAKKWLQQAVEQGNEEAQEMLENYFVT